MLNLLRPRGHRGLGLLGGPGKGVFMNSREKCPGVPRRTPQPGPGTGMPRRGSSGKRRRQTSFPILYGTEEVVVQMFLLFGLPCASLAVTVPASSIHLFVFFPLVVHSFFVLCVLPFPFLACLSSLMSVHIDAHFISSVFFISFSLFGIVFL